MERPEDFEDREESPAEVNAEIAGTAGDEDEAQPVSGAEDQPDI